MLKLRSCCVASRCSSSPTFKTQHIGADLNGRDDQEGSLKSGSWNGSSTISRNVGDHVQRDAGRQPRAAKTLTAPPRTQNIWRQSVFCVTAWEMIMWTAALEQGGVPGSIQGQIYWIFGWQVTLEQLSLPILQSSPVSTIPPLFHTHSFILKVLLSEGQAGEAWVPSKKHFSLRKAGCVRHKRIILNIMH